MTNLLSIRINQELLAEMKKNAKRLDMSQTEYIRQAIQMMNAETEKQARAKRLQQASLKVRAESMAVNAEFSKIERDPDA